MAIKRFNQGERVRHYRGGPIMQVTNYLPTKRHLIGSPQSGYWVKCIWYANGKEHCQVFNQDVLLKLNNHDGLLPHVRDLHIGQFSSSGV